MKRLLALTESADFVCYRYRVEAFRDALATRGWQLDVLPRARSFADFVGQMACVSAADAVLLQRRLLSWWKRRMLRRAANILIYDFDDAIYLRDSNDLKSPQDRKRQRRFRQTVRAADLCLAGNRHLEHQAARSAGPAKVCVIPTCVDHRRYPLARHRRVGADVQLVWVGSQSTVQSLHDAHASLLAACAAMSGIALKVVCDAFPQLDGVPTLPVSWESAKEAHDIASADIGVAWLPDHPWSLGKCGLKVLQYMAAGLPVVANPVGIHRELIIDGQTGFLPRTPAEWNDAIRALATLPQLRQRMGLAGRARLIEHFSVSAWGPRWAATVDGLIPHNRSRAA